jgi:hypothetical protein
LDKLKALSAAEAAEAWPFQIRFLYLPKIFWRDAGILMKLAMLGAVGCVFAAGPFRRRCLATLLISYGLFAAISFYLLATARLPERVSYNIPFFVLAICLYWATGFQNRPTGAEAHPARRRSRISRLAVLVVAPLWVAACLFCLSELARSLWAANASGRNLEQISRKILEPIRTLTPAKTTPVLVALPFDSVLEQCLFFHPVTEKLPFFLVPYGWITHSPAFDQILKRHRLEPYSRSLVDRPDVFFLMEPRWLEPLKIFYHEHYGLDVRFDSALNTDEMPPFEDCRLHLYQAHAIGDAAAGRDQSPLDR